MFGLQFLFVFVMLCLTFRILFTWYLTSHTIPCPISVSPNRCQIAVASPARKWSAPVLALFPEHWAVRDGAGCVTCTVCFSALATDQFTQLRKYQSDRAKCTPHQTFSRTDPDMFHKSISNKLLI